MGPPGLKLRSRIKGIFASKTVLPANPSILVIMFGANDGQNMIGADGNLTRPQTGGALQPAEVPASAVPSTTEGAQS